MTSPLLSLAAWTARVTPTGLKTALYRSGPLAGLVRRMLNRAAPHGLTRVEVAGGLLAGQTLELDLQTEKDYWLGTYEPELQAAIAARVRPGMVAYDLGANIGYITLMLAQAVGKDGQVIAIEALPHNLSRLRKNVVLNDLASQVTLVPGAVSDTSEEIEFQVGPSGATGKAAGSAGRQHQPGQVLPVAGIHLDDFVYRQGHPQPQIVKMDIEGGEINALPAMVKILRQAQPQLLLELHGPQSARVSWEVLTACDYQLFGLESGHPSIHSPDELDWKAYLLACPMGGELP